MGTSKEEILTKVQQYISYTKNGNVTPNQLGDFVKTIEQNIISLMKYFGMKNQEIEEEFSDFVYRLILALPKLRDDSKFSHFLFGFIRNCCKNYFREKRKVNWISIDELKNYIDNNFNEEVIYDNESNIKDLISYGFEKLDKIYSQALYMFYFEEKQISEITKELKCSEICIKIRLLRGKEKLAKILSKKIKEEGRL